MFPFSASGAPYNWLTQSSLDTYAADYTLAQNTSETQSSLLFTIGKKDPSRPDIGKGVIKGPGGSRGGGPLRGGAARQEGITVFSPQPTNLAEGYCYPPFRLSVRLLTFEMQ